MASNSPESPSKKRKQPTNTAQLKRDQPLFASRRPAPTLQQPPDFLTDSLNTSYIPSPSPEKSPTRQSFHAKPRQAGNRRSLTAAFRATANANDENKRPSSTSHIPTFQTRKAPPHHSTGHASPQSSNKKPQSPRRTRTPTPPRGRQVTVVTSPTNSESSPGRGYAEAYQRIVEEENLAQEDSVDGVNMDDSENSFKDQSQDLDRLTFQHIRNSSTPTSLKASRRGSPRNRTQAMFEENKSVDKENVADIAGIDPDNSQREETTTSSLDSGSSQYTKDLQRLHGALRGGSKAFSKARLDEKGGLTVENLRRQNGSHESLRSAHSVGSSSPRGSDQSINVPKAWGRKARPGNDWLSRINSRSGKLTGDVSKRRSLGEQIGDNEEGNRGDGVDEWTVAAAEVPLPNSGNGSSLVSSSSESAPIAKAQQTIALDRRPDREVDDDFTGRSLQFSESPPIRVRNATLDRLRNREIQNLEKQAVTTCRLGELRERTSDEHIKKRLVSRSSPEGSLDAHSTNQCTTHVIPSSGQSCSQLKPRTSKTEIPKASPGDSVQSAGGSTMNSPVVIYRTKINESVGADTTSATQAHRSRRAALRPKHERKDSHDLLKRLSRAASDSPSPDKDQLIGEHHSLESEKRIEQTPQVPKLAANMKTPVVTGAWVDQTVGETSLAPQPNSNRETPFVTGSWVDTPLPSGGRGPPMPTPSNVEDLKDLNTSRFATNDLIKELSSNAKPPRPQLRPQAPLKYTGPPLPKSALENIINSARGPKVPVKPAYSDVEEDPTLQLGESTIQSLEDMIANDTDISTILAPTPPFQETSPPSSDPPEPKEVSNAERNPSCSADPQSFTEILSRLTNLAPSIRDSKKQIASIERAVANTSSSSANGEIANANRCNEAGEFHDFIWPCQKCGCPGRMDPDFDRLLIMRDSFTSIRIPVPRLWRWRQGDRRPHLTWLGVLTFVAWAMVAAEAWARDRYCHPLYATSMVGYGVDIHAPRPPFVLLKVLYRKTAFGSVLAPVYHLSRITFKLLASLIGYIIGFMFGDEDGSGQVREPVSKDRRIPRPSWGPDLSMMDDEYI